MITMPRNRVTATATPQRKFHRLIPTQQGTKARAVLVGDLEFDRVEVELRPHADVGGLYVGDDGVAGGIPLARAPR